MKNRNTTKLRAVMPTAKMISTPVEEIVHTAFPEYISLKLEAFVTEFLILSTESSIYPRTSCNVAFIVQIDIVMKGCILRLQKSFHPA